MRDTETLPAGHAFASLPDQAERSRALHPARSFLVQAPAGSGKTYLLTQRFLRLLAKAEKPDEIVAITFTNAAAAEMRNRILDALERAAMEACAGDDPESLPALAAEALRRSKLLGWRILDQPSQLRITTIDAFCRGLALESPLSWGLLSGLGGRLEPVSNPKELYRRAATRTIELLNAEDSPSRRSVEAILAWRDNNWKDVEELIVKMLGVRNCWYQEFVFARDEDWESLRMRLEAPFRRAACGRLGALGRMLDGLPESRDFALSLVRFACGSPGRFSPLTLAERAELPSVFDAEEAPLLEDAVEAYHGLACFLLTAEGEWRKQGGLNVHHGFPATTVGRSGKQRFGAFVEALAQEPGLRAALAVFQQPMPVRYSDSEWELVRHCFAVLRYSAGQLQVVFAETGSVDFTEVAQIALRILAPENGLPSDFAMRQAAGIRHLLIDEFQDTSRSQHQLLSRLIAAWPEREGRSCFCVGDPMQSIYSFREAEVELFERARTRGLEIDHGPDAMPFSFDFVPLRANFRTAASLVEDLNQHFERIFSEDDSSGVRFTRAQAARKSQSAAKTELHLTFTRDGRPGAASAALGDPDATRRSQVKEIVALIQGKLDQMNRLRNAAKDSPETAPEKYRIAVLGRTKSSLPRLAEALREAGIVFRAIELVPLRERPEVLDALSLARAVLNPTDRTAWLAVLRAPWCGLSLQDLHRLTSADDAEVASTPVPVLLESRLPALFKQALLDPRAFAAASRVGRVLRSAVATRAAAGSSALGTWLESVWKALGGGNAVDAGQRANLRLLWAVLDKLPNGELDLFGPGLDAALDELCALPDPAAGSDFGVQLMTIHKSKGLEFEVVVVPDLEAEGKNSQRTMISWLERGLADSDSPDGAGQLTEFLIAPIQEKGTDAGAAKKWVDTVKREREKLELRRLLYVAATRAREELHLFARPRFRFSQALGRPALASPRGLLATAWPALGGEVEARFASWLASSPDCLAAPMDSDTETALELETLAAEAGALAQMPATQPAAKPTILRRLPEGYVAPEFPRPRASSSIGGVAEQLTRGDGADGTNPEPLYARTEGGLRSRLEGTAIHWLLEKLTRLRSGLGPEEAAHALADSLPPVAARIRSQGLPRAAAERLAREALVVAQRASTHPIGAWILSPHPGAQAETQWTGLMQPGPNPTSAAPGRQWNLRPDRVFFAPALALVESADAVGPLTAVGAEAASAETDPHWWIIDYKTSYAGGVNIEDQSELRAYLNFHRELHAGQLAAYSQVLRSLQGESSGRNLSIRAGIFYPRTQILDFWEA